MTPRVSRLQSTQRASLQTHMAPVIVSIGRDAAGEGTHQPNTSSIPMSTSTHWIYRVAG